MNSSYKKMWLYVSIMSGTSFRVNLRSIVCLNIKELLAWSRRHIWSLSDSNGTRTHYHLVHLRTKCLCVRFLLLSLKKIWIWNILTQYQGLLQTLFVGNSRTKIGTFFKRHKKLAYFYVLLHFALFSLASPFFWCFPAFRKTLPVHSSYLQPILKN